MVCFFCWDNICEKAGIIASGVAMARELGDQMRETQNLSFATMRRPKCELFQLRLRKMLRLCGEAASGDVILRMGASKHHTHTNTTTQILA